MLLLLTWWRGRRGLTKATDWRVAVPLLLLLRWRQGHLTTTIPKGWLVVTSQLQTHLLPLLLREWWHSTTPAG